MFSALRVIPQIKRAAVVVVSKDSCLDIFGGEIYACSEVLVVYAMSYSVAVHINNKVMMFINVNHNVGHSHYQSFHEATTL